MKTPNINIIVTEPVVGSCSNNNMIQCIILKTYQNLELFEEEKCSEIIEVFG